MTWTKLGSTSQLVPIPSRVTTWPVLPSVIVGNVGAAATRGRSAEAIAAPAPVAAAVLRKRLRLPPHEPWDPSIVTTFPLIGAGAFRQEISSSRAERETSRENGPHSGGRTGGWSTTIRHFARL